MEYQRSPRLKQKLPRAKIEIYQPTNRPQPPNFSYLQPIIYMVLSMLVTGISVSLYYYMSVSSNSIVNPNWLVVPLVSGLMMIIYSINPFIMYFLEKKNYKREQIAADKKYENYLQEQANILQQQVEAEKSVLESYNPSLIACLAIITERHRSLWDRSYEDKDFLDLRIGIGELPTSTNIILPKQDGYETDPLIEKAHQMAQKFMTVKDVPILLPLTEAKIVGIVGDKEGVGNVVRSLIIQIATQYSPDEVKVVTLFSTTEKKEWSWIRWLPHAWNDEQKVRYMATESTEAEDFLDELHQQLKRRKSLSAEAKIERLPYYLFFITESMLIEQAAILPLLLEAASKIGAYVFFVTDAKQNLPNQCQSIIEMHANQGKLLIKRNQSKSSEEQQEYTFDVDQVTIDLADQAARSLAPLRLKTSHIPKIPNLVTLFDLWNGMEIDKWHIRNRWDQNRYPDSIPIEIGISEGNKKVTLNLHDKIERGGQGPHGLIAGTTGSGKSEVIQTMIASAALTYHPHDLAFLLIDYKGGGMSNTFHQLPHVVGSITNLDGNLIERAKVSLKAELTRREQIFKAAGNLQHIDEYYQSPMRATKPLPHLVIIIDEFAELKKEQPDFMNELISIAAKGRTLGVHLLLATQKPGGVVDDKIWSNARFRICLRVQDEADSREMIKRPDAAWITVPGRGYLQVGSNEVFQLVQFAWSGAPYQTDLIQTSSLSEVTLNGKRIQKLNGHLSKKRQHEGNEQKQLQVFQQAMVTKAMQLKIQPLIGPWLPPLSTNIYIEELITNVVGWNGTGWHDVDTWLQPVVGIFDDPMKQSQQTLRISLATGHLPVYGMPGTGKTTFVQTILFSLAMTHSPEQVHFYILDFGHMFREFTDFPHVGAIIREDEHDRIKRLFRFLQQKINERRELFADVGAKSYTAYRELGGKPLPAMVVVIDGYLTFRNTFEEENQELINILREGGGLGIHFIVTANGISDMFEPVRSNFVLGISFPLADPSDYYFAIGRTNMKLIHAPIGRGFVKSDAYPLEFQTALPVRRAKDVERSKLLRQWANVMSTAWAGEHPKPIESLPEIIDLEELLQTTENTDIAPYQAPIAITSDDLAPFGIGLQDGPYFVIATPVEGGKTSFLQTWMLSLTYFTPPEKLQIQIIDFRADDDRLASLQNIPQIKSYVTNENELDELLQRLVTEFQERSNDNQREKSIKPAIFLVIDNADYLYKKCEQNYTLKTLLDQVISLGRNRGLYIAITGTPTDFPQYNTKDWFSEIHSFECGFLFHTLDSNDLSFMKIPTTEASIISSPVSKKVLGPCEGYFTKRRRFIKMKGAFVNTSAVPQLIQKIQRKWS